MSYLIPASANQMGEQSSSFTSNPNNPAHKSPLSVLRGPGSRGGKGFFRVVTKGKFKGQVLYCYGTYSQIHTALQNLKSQQTDPVDNDVFDQFINDLQKNKEESGAEAGTEDIEGIGPLVDHAQESVENGGDPSGASAIINLFNHRMIVGNLLNSDYYDYASQEGVNPGNMQDVLNLLGGLVVGVDHSDGMPLFSETGHLGISGLIEKAQSHVPKKDDAGNHYITHEFAMMVLQNLQSTMINSHSISVHSIRATLSKLAQIIREKFPQSDFELNAQAALNTQAEVWMQHGDDLSQLNINDLGHLSQNAMGEGWDSAPEDKTRDVEDLGMNPSSDEYVRDTSRPKMTSDNIDEHAAQNSTESVKEQAQRVFTLVKSRANQILQALFSHTPAESYQKQEIHDVIRNFLSPASTEGVERDQYEKAQNMMLVKNGNARSVRISQFGSVDSVPIIGAFNALTDKHVTGKTDAPYQRALSAINAMAYVLGITPDGMWKSLLRNIDDLGGLDGLAKLGSSYKENYIEDLKKHFLLYEGKKKSPGSPELSFELSNMSSEPSKKITEEGAKLIVELAKMTNKEFSEIKKSPMIDGKDYSPYVDMVSQWRKIYMGDSGLLHLKINWVNSNNILETVAQGGFSEDHPTVQALLAGQGSEKINHPDFPAEMIAALDSAGFVATLRKLAERITFVETLKKNLTTGGALFSGATQVSDKDLDAQYGQLIENMKLQFVPVLNALKVHFYNQKENIENVNYALIKRLGMFGKGPIESQRPELCLSDGINTRMLGSRGDNPPFDKNMQIARWNRNASSVSSNAENLIADPLAISVEHKIDLKNWNLDFFKQLIQASSRPVVPGQARSSFVSNDVSGQSAPVIITLQHIAKALLGEHLPFDEDDYPIVGENSDANPFNTNGSLRKVIDALKDKYSQSSSTFISMKDFMNLLTNNGQSRIRGIEDPQVILSLVQKTVLQAQECERLNISPVPITSIPAYLPEMGATSQDPATRRDEVYGRQTTTSASAPLVYFVGGNGHVLQTANRIAFYDDPILDIDKLQNDVLGFFSHNQSRVSRQIEIPSGELGSVSRTEYTTQFKSAMTTLFAQLNLYGIDTGNVFSVTHGHLDLNHITGNGTFKATSQHNGILTPERLMLFFNQLRPKIQERIKELFKAAENLHYQSADAPISLLVADNPYITEYNGFSDNSGKYFMQSDKLLAQKLEEFAKEKKEPMNVGIIVIPSLERYSGNMMENLPRSASRKSAIQSYVLGLNDEERDQIYPQINQPIGSSSMGTAELAEALDSPDASARVITTHDVEYPDLLKTSDIKSSAPEVLFVSKNDDGSKLSKIFKSTKRVLVRNVSKDNLQLFLDSSVAKDLTIVIEKSELYNIFGNKYSDLMDFFKRNKDTNFIIVGSPEDRLRPVANCATVSAHPFNFFSSNNPDSQKRKDENSQLAFRLSAGILADPSRRVASDIPQISWDNISKNDSSFMEFSDEMNERSTNHQFTKMADDRSVSWQDFFLDRNKEKIGGMDNSANNVCVLSPYAPSVTGGVFQPTEQSYKFPDNAMGMTIPPSDPSQAVGVPSESELSQIDPVQKYTIPQSLDAMTKDGGIRVRPGRGALTRIALQQGSMLSENIKKALGFSGIVGHVCANSLQYKLASAFADTGKKVFVFKPSWAGSIDSEQSVLDREKPASRVIDVTKRGLDASERFNSESLARIQNRFLPVSMRSILQTSNVDHVPVAGLNDDEATVVKAIQKLINAYVQSLNDDIKHGRVTSTVKVAGLEKVLAAPHKRNADGWVYKYDPDSIITEARGAGNLPLDLMARFIDVLDSKSKSAYLQYRYASRQNLLKEKPSSLYPADSRSGNWALLKGKSLLRDRDIPIASFGSSQSSEGFAREERFPFQFPGAIPMNTQSYVDINPDSASGRDIESFSDWGELGDSQTSVGKLSQAAGLYRFLTVPTARYFQSIGTGQDAYRWNLIKRLEKTPETLMRIQSNLFPNIHAEATYQHGSRQSGPSLKPYSVARVRLFSSLSRNVPLMDIPVEHWSERTDNEGDEVSEAKLHYVKFDRMLIDLSARMISAYLADKLIETYKDIKEKKKSRVQDKVFPPNTWPTFDDGTAYEKATGDIWDIVHTPDLSVIRKTADAFGLSPDQRVSPEPPADITSIEHLLSNRSAPIDLSHLMRSWIFSQYRKLSRIILPSRADDRSLSRVPDSPALTLNPNSWSENPRPSSPREFASNDVDNIPAWNNTELKDEVERLINNKQHEKVIYGMTETGKITEEYIYNPTSPHYNSITEFYEHAYIDMNAMTKNEQIDQEKIEEQERVKRFNDFVMDHFGRPANRGYMNFVEKMTMGPKYKQNIPERIIGVSDEAISVAKKLIEYWKRNNHRLLGSREKGGGNDDEVAAKSILRELRKQPEQRAHYLLNERKPVGDITQARAGEFLGRARTRQKERFDDLKEQIEQALVQMLEEINPQGEDLADDKDDPLEHPLARSMSFLYFKKKVART